MVTINLDEKSVENFKAIRELQSMGYSDEQIQKWYENFYEHLPDYVGALKPIELIDHTFWENIDGEDINVSTK